MAQALVEWGVLQERGGGWVLQGALEAITVGVPESLRATIEQQMSRLPPEAQLVLEAASVAGMEFSAAAVAAGIDTSVDIVETQCATLARRRQFIQQRDADTWPDGTVTECYGFVHALYQKTLYDQIPASRQVRWHRPIGARLEAGYGTQAPEMAAELAGHFVRGRDAERAVRYLRYAGEQALYRSAHQEASTHFTHGLELLQALPHTAEHTLEVIDLCLAERMALHPLGEYERVLAYLRQAEPLAMALDDDQRCGRIAAYMASCFRMLADHEGAIAASQRAMTAARDDVALQVVAQHLLGQSYYSLGDFRRAQEFFHKNMALLTGERQFESFSLSYFPAVGALVYLVFCLVHAGQFAEALVHCEASLQLAEQAQHPMSLIVARRGLCRVHYERGDFQQAIPMLEGVIERCRSWHIRDGLPNDLSMLGYAYTLGGRLTEGLLLLEQAVEQSEAIKTRYHQAQRYARLSRGYLLAGRLAEADTYAQHAFDLACTYRERPAEAWSLYLCGDLAAQSTPLDLAKAEAYYQQALALAHTLGMRPLLAHGHLSLGTLYSQTDRLESARAELAAALALYRAMEMTWWSSQAEIALAHLSSVASAQR
jgi:tetratricopeptide (TPR) repeat protein